MKFVKCPDCGKIVLYEGTFCSECYNKFDNMNISDGDFVKPLFEKKYVYAQNEDYSIVLVMFTETDGLKITYSPTMHNFLCQQLKKNGNILSIIDDFMPEQYEVGDWYIVPISGMNAYKGTIPDTNYFEVFCTTDTSATLDIWFTNNGDMFMYEPEGMNLKPIKKGSYVREGNVLRYELTDLKNGTKKKSFSYIINERYCPTVYVSEDNVEYYKSEGNKPLSISNPTVASAIITEQEFFDNYPCLICNARQIWIKKEWKHYAYGQISAHAECKLCGHIAHEIENPEKIKRIAYHGSDPIPGYRLPAGSVRYLDNPCPYCHAYQVRYIKWKDKRASIYFWGRLSSKIGTHYICDNCKKTWE